MIFYPVLLINRKLCWAKAFSKNFNQFSKTKTRNNEITKLKRKLAIILIFWENFSKNSISG